MDFNCLRPDEQRITIVVIRGPCDATRKIRHLSRPAYAGRESVIRSRNRYDELAGDMPGGADLLRGGDLFHREGLFYAQVE